MFCGRAVRRKGKGRGGMCYSVKTPVDSDKISKESIYEHTEECNCGLGRIWINKHFDEGETVTMVDSP